MALDSAPVVQEQTGRTGITADFEFEQACSPPTGSLMGTDTDHIPRRRRSRLEFVDMARGMTIALMVLADNADGDRPWWLGHAKWNGLHLADFVMPWFLVILGMSVALSVTAQKRRQTARGAIMGRALLRTAKLFALGVLLQGGTATQHFPGWDLATVRIMGVLQRIALCYLIVSLVVVYVSPIIPPGTEQALEDLHWNEQAGMHASLAVPTVYSLWWLIASLVFVAYGIASYHISIPYCALWPPNEPGCNVPAYVDSLILGQQHMYPWAACRRASPRECEFFDPEGLFTSIGASVSAFIGVYFGMIFVVHGSHKIRCTEVVRMSLLLLALGALFLWQGGTVNKNLYSLTYILITGGSGGLLLVAMYAGHNVFPSKAFNDAMQPFLWLGSNGIAMYAGDELLQEVEKWIYYADKANNLGAWVRRGLLVVTREQWSAKLAFAFLHLAIFVGLGAWLYRRRLFFKI